MATEQTANPLNQFIIPYLLIFMIFYFLVFKPQKEQKAKKKMLSEIKRNDEVITNSGIHGTVVNIKETSFVLRIDDNVKIEIEKDAVATIKKKTDSITK